MVSWITRWFLLFNTVADSLPLLRFAFLVGVVAAAILSGLCLALPSRTVAAVYIAFLPLRPSCRRCRWILLLYACSAAVCVVTVLFHTCLC
jgi:hypothetical protein